MPLAAHKSSELVDRMNNILERRHNGISTPVSEFEIAQLKGDAKKLPDAADKELILGMISTVEAKYNNTKKHFNLALSYDPTSTEILSNYAISLENLGQYEEAVEKAAIAYKYAPGDKKVLRLLISFSMLAGYFRDAHALLAEWNKIAPDTTHTNAEMITEIAHFIQDNNLSESDIQKAISIASSLVREYQYPILHAEIAIPTDENDEWISYLIHVGCPVYNTNKLNDLFIDNLIDKFEAAEPKGISVTFLSRE